MRTQLEHNMIVMELAGTIGHLAGMIGVLYKLNEEETENLANDICNVIPDSDTKVDDKRIKHHIKNGLTFLIKWMEERDQDVLKN